MTNIGRICYIYGLADPISGNLRYIGKSICPESRFKSHLRISVPKNPKEFWVISLRKLGLEPELIILEVVSEKRSAEAEIFWIAEYRSRGFNLTNKTIGGQGSTGWHPSLEQLNKLSSALRGNTNRKGKPASEESRKKMSLSHIGKSPSNKGLRGRGGWKVHNRKSNKCQPDCACHKHKPTWNAGLSIGGIKCRPDCVCRKHSWRKSRMNNA